MGVVCSTARAEVERLNGKTHGRLAVEVSALFTCVTEKLFNLALIHNLPAVLERQVCWGEVQLIRSRVFRRVRPIDCTVFTLDSCFQPERLNMQTACTNCWW